MPRRLRLGNYAADIATMGQHYELADWLRKHCSVDRTESYMILGLDENAMSTLLSQPIPKSTPHTNNDHAEKLDLTEYHNRVREAYLEKARHHHPDRNSSPEASEMFVKVKRAYDHLINEGRAMLLLRLSHGTPLISCAFRWHWATEQQSA
jgi:hypothetical protein